MPTYTVSYRCLETSWGWGKKGDTNQIIFSNRSAEEIRDLAKSYAPGNWEIKTIAETTPCLRVQIRMECPECEYPFSEALYPLDPKVPHTEWIRE